MTVGWDSFSAGELRQLAGALRCGTIASPPNALALHRHMAPGRAAWLAEELARLSGSSTTVAAFIDLLATERERVERLSDSVQLVWSGPELPGLASRDTGAVVRELFGSAERKLLIVGYAVHQGRQLFQVLADRMDSDADLSVRMVVDISRRYGNTSLEHELVLNFARHFREREWPGQRLPEVYYDPRSLSPDTDKRSSMHAKCIAADGERALVTSANFTEAAQQRNIEVGVLVRSARVAGSLQARFEMLIDQREVVRLPE